MFRLETEWLLVVQAAATWFMTGLIWYVQLVHYPLMANVGAERFAGYEAAHTRWTGVVVGPPMIVEAATSLFALIRPPAGVPPGQAWLGVSLLAGIWLSTVTLQMPQHRRLAAGFSPAAHRKLVRTNWIRVAGWSLRAGLVLHWLS